MSSYFANYDNSDPPLKRHLSSVWNKKHLNLAQAGDHYRQTTRRDHHHQNSRPNAMLNLRTGANKVINRLFKRQTAYWNKYTLNNGHCKNSLLQNTCRHRSNFMDKNKGSGYEVIVHRGLSHGTQSTGVPDASMKYGSRQAEPRYQVEFMILQLSAFPWLTENWFLCFHFVWRFDNLLW